MRASPVPIPLPLLTALALLSLAPLHADAQGGAVPGEHSRLYYRIGGGEPVSRAANPLSAPVKIGIGGAARMNYSCGNFDAGATIENLMNDFAQAGDVISNGVRAGIAALPLYVLQRASPGLYELFQTYKRKAEAMWTIAMQSCEQMESEIKAGGDPYEEWIKIAQAEDWKTASASLRDAVLAKQLVATHGGTQGLTWIGGQRKGGRNQPAIQLVRDVAEAGYQVTMNRPVATPPTTVYDGSTKLGRAFPSARLAADWLVEVIGDRQISSCDEPACQAKASLPGTGLLPKVEAETQAARLQLRGLVEANAAPQGAPLEAASAPGIAITRELVEALRTVPATERDIVLDRLAMEVAQARVIDRALMLRTVLLTGSGLPEVGYGPAQDELRERVHRLNRHIDDLLFETRVRREVVSSAATAVLEAHGKRAKAAGATERDAAADPLPVNKGRVQP